MNGVRKLSCLTEARIHAGLQTVLMKKGVEVIVYAKIVNPQRRFNILKAEFNYNLYVLINVYAPNKDKDSVKFLEALRTTLRTENLDIEEILL